MDFFGLFTINPQSFNVWSLRISLTLTTVIFILGCTTAIRALLHAKSVDPEHLDNIKEHQSLPEDTLAESVAKMLWSTSKNDAALGQSSPKEFLYDATREVAQNSFNGAFVNRIYMCANLLPPIGLWGTVAGMIVIFLYTGDPGSAINNGAIGTKLWSTYFALIYYVSLQAICIALDVIGKRSIDRGLQVKL
jgi:biopolymer transport protein ExbB/TolQ